MPWHVGHRSGQMGYQPGLDGLRAIAVLGVVLYHADFDWMNGGFLGVDVFFVLSGFLITSIILEEFQRSGRIDFRRFYLRRARRLLPALFVMLFVVGVLTLFVYRDSARAFANDATSALFYVTNWWYIFAEQSYFEFTGRPPLLRHLWSLAVEEQFYLIWPVVVYLLLRRGNRSRVRWVAIGLAIASTLWMAYLSVRLQMPEYNDPSRIYFGTDSHIMGLLVGAALATVWRPGALSPNISPAARVTIMAIGLTSLLTTLWFMLFVGQFTPWLYQGGFLVLAIIVAALIAAATHPAVPLGRWLGTQPFRYLGQRSYGIYLWHWPIFMMTRPQLDTPLDGLSNLTLRLTLTLAVAEASYRFIEMPVRRGDLGRWWRRVGPRVGAAAVSIVIALTVGLGIALFQVPTPSFAQGLPADVKVAIGDTEEVLIDDEPDPTLSVIETTEEPIEQQTPDRSRNGPVTVLGDSVVLGARSAITDAIPGAKVDAEVARMPGAFIGRIKRLDNRNRLADVVVLHPATNGVLPEPMMREMLELLSDYPRVVVVNAKMPRTWRKPNNATIAAVIPDYPNAVLVDWYGYAKDRPEFFASDGIHLTKTGAAEFAKLIQEAADLPNAEADVRTPDLVSQSR
jgi:peptidoglycan/LPS O-acetylase OafA/YrhL